MVLEKLRLPAARGGESIPLLMSGTPCIAIVCVQFWDDDDDEEAPMRLEIVPALFWIGHLLVAVWGFIVLRRHAAGVPADRRAIFLTVGGGLVLLALIPGAFASSFALGLALGTMAMSGLPVGAEGAAVIATPIGLLAAASVIYLVVRLTKAAFAHGSTPAAVSAD